LIVETVEVVAGSCVWSVAKVCVGRVKQGHKILGKCLN
jgi:hypothetical protein